MNYQQPQEPRHPVPDPGRRHAGLWHGDAHHALLHREHGRQRAPSWACWWPSRPSSSSSALPLWGSVSDRRGRKPVLVVGLLGYGISMLLFGLSTELWMLFVARGVGAHPLGGHDADDDGLRQRQHLGGGAGRRDGRAGGGHGPGHGARPGAGRAGWAASRCPRPSSSPPASAC